MSPAGGLAARARAGSEQRLLLDTHALLWWLTDSRKMSGAWRAALADPASAVFLSAASVWEMAIKMAIGKLTMRFPAGVALAGLAEFCGFEDLPVTARHAAAVLDLPARHSDPFDRILIAQAKTEGLTVVTTDPAVLGYGVPSLPAS